MNLESIMLGEKEPDTKGCMFYNSNDVQCPEQADPYRQKTQTGGCQGLEEARGMEVSSGVMTLS